MLSDRFHILRELSKDFVDIELKKTAGKLTNKMAERAEATSSDDAYKNWPQFIAEPENLLEDDEDEGISSIAEDFAREYVPYVPHPVSLGHDYELVQRAFETRGKIEKAINKTNKRRSRCQTSLFKLPPIEFFITKKPIFPNFIDPVPEGHRFPGEPQVHQVTSTTSSDEGYHSSCKI